MTDTLKALAERRHPDHAANAAEWRFIRQAVEGGPAFVAANLYRHPLEEEAVFKARKARAADHHYNLSAQVLGTYTGYLFQTPPTLKSGVPDWLERFIARGDIDGRPLVELAKDATTWCLGKGVVWLAVDKPAADPELVAKASRAQELEAGLEPYAYLVHPDAVLDGKLERGMPVWLLVQEDKRDDGDPWTSSGETAVRLRLWEQHQWTVLRKVKRAGSEEEAWEVEAQGVNALGRVPFVPLRYGAGTGFACPGLLSDIAHLDRALLNKASLLDEIHYTVTFPQVTIPYEGELYQAKAEGEGFELTPEGQGIMTMGLHHVLPYPAAAGAPGYMSPPSGPADTLQGAIDRLVRMVFILGLLDGEVAVEGEGNTSSASGVSKAYTFEKLNRRLATIADRVEAAFDLLFELVAMLNGQPVETVRELGVVWDFPESFEVRSMAADLEEFSALLAAGIPSATAKLELWSRILRKALPKLDEEAWEAIEEELEAALGDQATGTMGPLLAKLAGAVGKGELGDQGETNDDQVEGEEEAA